MPANKREYCFFHKKCNASEWQDFTGSTASQKCCCVPLYQLTIITYLLIKYSFIVLL